MAWSPECASACGPGRSSWPGPARAVLGSVHSWRRGAPQAACAMLARALTRALAATPRQRSTCWLTLACWPQPAWAGPHACPTVRCAAGCTGPRRQQHSAPPPCRAGQAHLLVRQGRSQEMLAREQLPPQCQAPRPSCPARPAEVHPLLQLLLPGWRPQQLCLLDALPARMGGCALLQAPQGLQSQVSARRSGWPVMPAAWHAVQPGPQGLGWLLGLLPVVLAGGALHELPAGALAVVLRLQGMAAPVQRCRGLGLSRLRGWQAECQGPAATSGARCGQQQADSLRKCSGRGRSMMMDGSHRHRHVPPAALPEPAICWGRPSACRQVWLGTGRWAHAAHARCRSHVAALLYGRRGQCRAGCPRHLRR